MIGWAISIVYSLIWNLICFDFKRAIKLPLIIHYKVNVKGLRRNCIEISEPVHFGMIRIGFSKGSFEGGAGKRTLIRFVGSGKIHVKDVAYIPQSSTINISDGELYLGSNFQSNYGLLISCENKIKFGDDCAIGWDCTFLDGDGHTIVSESGGINNSREIEIGNHAWICSKCTLLKGAKVGHNCVVAFGSTLTKPYANDHTLIGSRNGAVELKAIREWRK